MQTKKIEIVIEGEAKDVAPVIALLEMQAINQISVIEEKGGSGSILIWRMDLLRKRGSKYKEVKNEK